jgi:hypothetical protein
MSASDITQYIPYFTLLGGIITAATWGSKILISVYKKWIAWDDSRTDARIEAKFGDYDKNSLDKVLNDLCASLNNNAKTQDYNKMRNDISKIQGALNVLTRGEFKSV